MHLGKRIKELRIKKGLTQLELGNILFVNDRTISKWEQERGNPDVNIIPALANALGVSIDYLMTGNEYVPAEADDQLKAIEYFESLIEQPLEVDYLRRMISKQVQSNGLDKVKDALDRCYEVYLTKYQKPYKQEELRNALGKINGILYYLSLSPLDAKVNMLVSYLSKNTNDYTAEDKVNCEKLVRNLLDIIVESGDDERKIKKLDALYRYVKSHRCDISDFRALYDVLISEREYQKEAKKRIEDGFLELSPSLPEQLIINVDNINNGLKENNNEIVVKNIIDGINNLYVYVFEKIDKETVGKLPHITTYYNSLYVILGKFINLRNMNNTRNLLNRYYKDKASTINLYDIDTFYGLVTNMLNKVDKHTRSARNNYNKEFIDNLIKRNEKKQLSNK